MVSTFLTPSHELRHVSHSLHNSLAGKDMQSIDSEDMFSKKWTVRLASTGQNLPGMHCPAGAGLRVPQQDLAGKKARASSWKGLPSALLQSEPTPGPTATSHEIPPHSARPASLGDQLSQTAWD